MLRPEERDRKIELGILYLKEGNYHESLRFLREVYSGYGKDEKTPPYILSLYGYVMAMAENRIDEATILCIRALKEDPDNPAFYLNLGRIYLKVGKKTSAIKILRQGLISDKNNREIRAEMEKLGIRRRPIIAILPRNHPINRFLGIIARKLSEKRRGVEFDPTRSK